MSLRLDEAEFAALAQAARAARLTPSGYLAQLLQDSSGAAAVVGREPLRQVVAGLVEATVAVAGLAAGLDAGLGGHGVPPGRVEAVLDRLDDATLAALAELRRLRPAGVRR